MDVFICGVCHMGFHDIGKFVDHKNSLGSIGCSLCSAIFHSEDELAHHSQQQHATDTQVSEPAYVEMLLEQNMDTEQSAEGSVSHLASANVTGTAADSQTIVVTESFSFEATENSVVSDIFACSLCQCFTLSEEEIVNHINECHETNVSKDCKDISSLYCRLQQLGSTVVTAPGEERRTLRMLPVDVEEPPAQTTTLHLVVETSNPPIQPKRRRGRPRKADQIKRPAPVVEKVEEPDTLTRGQDGLFHCTRCKRVFCKERHILGHKCMAKGDYVDSFDKKDDESSATLEEDMKDADNTEDFRLHRTNEREAWTRGRGRRGGHRGGHRGGLSQGTSETSLDEITAGPGEANKENVAGQEHATADKSAEGGSEEAEELAPRKLHWREDPQHVPVFSRDEERLAFEEHLNQVDLSCVDHLYTQHLVAQEITCPPGTRLTPKEVCDLHVFSCNVCKKVFKTQSHMRLHCLIHTDLKPFTCHQCDFSSNAKGNLYTHMRKHTGNYFKCSRCSFRSCNRSHMAEHEATHSSVRQHCKLCSNDYNTIKSLVNHVRKYHTTPAGKRYLATFQNKQLQNMAVLHVCHLCNRKFKKKVDRDRHLKHRLVYVCSICCGLHLSATALRAHLQKEHLDKRDAPTDSRPDSSIQCFVAESGPVSTAEETVPVETSTEQNDAPEQSDASEPTRASTQSEAAPESEVSAQGTVPSDATLESLFADSISQSWYLPEPDGIASGYVNIPQELTENSPECNPGAPTETQVTPTEQTGPPQ
ncbi:hypothetical protein MRX96_019628 [Rhipicephalus microplus]